MSSSEITIKVENLGKCYHIYHQPQDRLKQSLIPRLQTLSGRTPRKYFSEFWALQNVSFDVKEGETVGVIGRNGSGKSTLLQLICGTLSPTTGTVETRGRVAALLELGSGFNPEFTGRENVYLNGAILGLAKEEIDYRFSDIAAFADIGDFIEHPVKMYSSGMAVRLAFAVQAMIDPDILIIDEALSVGDEKFQRKCFARIEELKSNGTSILFVSHMGMQVVELCQRVLLLDQGKRLMYSLPLEAVRAYQKLMYAPINEQKRLVDEFQAREAVIDGYIEPDEISTGSDHFLSTVFDAGLIPETTQVYPIQGAEIESFRILNTDKQPVNILQPGQEYRFEVSGRFLSDREGIYFGLQIRSTSGTVIAGQRYPEEGNFIEHVYAGQSFRITFVFKMLLVPGVYFVGGGIWSTTEPSCLHRILDALMFRIMPEDKSSSLGYVNISSMEPAFEVIQPEKH